MAVTTYMLGPLVSMWQLAGTDNNMRWCVVTLVLNKYYRNLVLSLQLANVQEKKVVKMCLF